MRGRVFVSPSVISIKSKHCMNATTFCKRVYKSCCFNLSGINGNDSNSTQFDFTNSKLCTSSTKWYSIGAQLGT